VGVPGGGRLGIHQVHERGSGNGGGRIHETSSLGQVGGRHSEETNSQRNRSLGNVEWFITGMGVFGGA